MAKNTYIQLRISDIEKSKVEETAKSLGMSMSEYILMLIRTDINKR